jgi:D-erythrulose 4-kinase
VTRLVNDPHRFADEAADGFARAFAPWVQRVRGGVVRSAPASTEEVAVVIGGGSGHYPAFAGLVGPGIAHGAVMGNVFASPSAQQVYAVARAVEQGRGVLLSYGNYAGDVLNFDRAQERLRAEGVGCETVVVTDDISSAPPGRAGDRRGIAGGLVVYKAAGAASARGLPLTEVARLARKANDRTRTLGVAFSGCSLPGADRPLFTVPDGRMAVGMGVHGEPGIDETAVPTAHGLAELLVREVLKERMGDRAALILNGLGAVKYEELFVVYGSVADLLTRAGVSIVEPEVGELVTSFDMAGVSLTLCWLDDELEDLWRAPASTPSFRKGSLSVARIPARKVQEAPAEEIPAADDGSRRVAGLIRDALVAVRAVIEESVEELGRLDAIAGDGDHGIGMRRGVVAATEAATAAVTAGAGAGTALRHAGDAWGDRAGGTSGALWAAALIAAGDVLTDQEPAADALSRTVDAATAAVLSAGGAAVGDRTLVDALVPFRDALRAALGAGSDPATAFATAVPVADAAARATANLVPRKGRAKAHAVRSQGSPDPGAVSLALVLRAAADSVNEGAR